jgi:hypothetical protein
MKAMRKIADVLAVIFHPVFLFFYWVILPPEEPMKWRTQIVITAFLLTVILPIIFARFFSRDIFLKEQKTRWFPLLGAIVAYSIMALLAKYHWEEEDIYWGCLLVLFCLLLLCAGTLFLKVSFHAAGFGAVLNYLLLAFIFGLSLGLGFSAKDISIFALILLIIIVVLWQRVQSKSHTAPEIITGLFIGLTAATIADYLHYGETVYHSLFEG